jgi:hypothetical protein
VEIKYCMKTLLIILLFIICVFAETKVNSGDNSLCIDEQILSEPERSPRYNLLSFPAVSTDDPYIIAASYFNNKMNIIVRENYVTQYEYSGVSYPVYKSFLNSEVKKDYYENCIKDYYEVSKVY